MLNKLQMLLVLFGIIGLPLHASNTTQVVTAKPSAVSINQNGKTVSFIYSDSISDDNNGFIEKPIQYSSKGGTGNDFTTGKTYTLKTKKDNTSLVNLVKDATGEVQLKITSTLTELKFEFGPVFKYTDDYKQYTTGLLFMEKDSKGQAIRKTALCDLKQFDVLCVGMGHPECGSLPILLTERTDKDWTEAKKDLLIGLYECFVVAAKISDTDPQQILLARCVMASITGVLEGFELSYKISLVRHNSSILPVMDDFMRNVSLRPKFDKVYGKPYNGLYNELCETALYYTPIPRLTGCSSWKTNEDNQYTIPPTWLNNWENNKGNGVITV